MQKQTPCEFGRKVKHALIDLEKTQEWLIEEVKKDRGKYFDSSYLSKILLGKNKNPLVIESISKILSL